MICPNCGTNLDDNVTECFLCGCHINTEQNVYAEKQNESANTCPTCGSEISEQDNICPVCGMPIEALIPIENTDEEYQSKDNSEIFSIPEQTVNMPSENEENNSEERSKKSNTPIIVLIILLVVAVIALIAFAFLYFTKDNPDDNIVSVSNSISETTTESAVTESTTSTTTTTTTTETTTTQITTSTTETTTTPIAALLNEEDYIGYWHIENCAENELTIHSIDAPTVTFSLWYYRLWSIDYLTATIEGKSAYFYDDEIEGVLTFNDDSIEHYVTMSDIPGIPSQYEEVYSMRVEDSIQYGNNMQDDYGNDAANEIQASVEPYAETETTTVDGVEFEYITHYSDSDIAVNINSVVITHTKEMAYYDEYEIKIEGIIKDNLVREKYLGCYMYDAQGYQLDGITIAKVSNSIQASYKFTVWDKNTARVFIDIFA